MSAKSRRDRLSPRDSSKDARDGSSKEHKLHSGSARSREELEFSIAPSSNGGHSSRSHDGRGSDILRPIAADTFRPVSINSSEPRPKSDDFRGPISDVSMAKSLFSDRSPGSQKDLSSDRSSSNIVPTSTAPEVMEGQSAAEGHQDLGSLVKQFIDDTTDYSALKARKKAAKKVVDMRTSEYMKCKPYHEEFPPTEESQRRSKEQAEKDYELVCETLQAKSASLDNFVQQSVPNLIPSISGAAIESQALQRLQGQFGKLERTCEVFQKKFQDQEKIKEELYQKSREQQRTIEKFETLEHSHRELQKRCMEAEARCRTSQTDIEILRRDLTAVNANVSGVSVELASDFSKRWMETEAKCHALQNDTGILRQELTAVNNNVSAVSVALADEFKEKLENLSRHVDDTCNLRIEITKTKEESVKSSKALQEHNQKFEKLEQLGTVIHGDGSSSGTSGGIKGALIQLAVDQELFRTGLDKWKDLSEEIISFRGRLAAIEDRANTPASDESIQDESIHTREREFSRKEQSTGSILKQQMSELDGEFAGVKSPQGNVENMSRRLDVLQESFFFLSEQLLQGSYAHIVHPAMETRVDDAVIEDVVSESSMKATGKQAHTEKTLELPDGHLDLCTIHERLCVLEGVERSKGDYRTSLDNTLNVEETEASRPSSASLSNGTDSENRSTEVEKTTSHIQRDIPGELATLTRAFQIHAKAFETRTEAFDVFKFQQESADKVVGETMMGLENNVDFLQTRYHLMGEDISRLETGAVNQESAGKVSEAMIAGLQSNVEVLQTHYHLMAEVVSNLKTGIVKQKNADKDSKATVTGLESNVNSLQKRFHLMVKDISALRTGVAQQENVDKATGEALTGLKRIVDFLQTHYRLIGEEMSQLKAGAVQQGDADKVAGAKMTELENNVNFFQTHYQMIGEEMSQLKAGVVQQGDADKVAGAKMTELENNVDLLKSRYQLMAEDLTKLQTGIENVKQQTAPLFDLPVKFESLQSSHNTLVATATTNIIEMVRSNPDFLALFTNIFKDHLSQSIEQLEGRLTSSVTSQQVSSAALENKLNSFENRIEAFDLGIHQICKRLDNISTMDLAMHMLSQLDSVYPNARNADNSIVKLERCTQNLEVQVQAIEARIQQPSDTEFGKSLREKVDELTSLLSTASSSARAAKDGLAAMQSDNQARKEVITNQFAEIHTEILNLKNMQHSLASQPVRDATMATAALVNTLSPNGSYSGAKPSNDPSYHLQKSSNLTESGIKKRKAVNGVASLSKTNGSYGSRPRKKLRRGYISEDPDDSLFEPPQPGISDDDGESS